MDNATQYDKFDSDFLVWTDAALDQEFAFNTVYPENHLIKWF